MHSLRGPSTPITRANALVMGISSCGGRALLSLIARSSGATGSKLFQLGLEHGLETVAVLVLKGAQLGNAGLESGLLVLHGVQ